MLLVDEAYMLYPRRGAATRNCPFRTEIMDTIVGEVRNTCGEDECMIMYGYKQEMKT